MTIENWIFISFLIAFLLMAIITIVVQKAFIKKNEEYALKQSSSQNTGAEVARKVLEKHNINNVRVVLGVEGKDHFDPSTSTISLSPSVFNSSSVSAMAIASHEASHAVQWNENILSVRIRDAVLKPVSIITQVGQSLFFFGIFMMIFMSGSWIVWVTLIGLVLYCAMGLYQLITLPIEFGASKRAKKDLKSLGLMVTSNDIKGTKGVLNVAAMTYVVAFLTSVLLVAFFLIQIIGWRG